MTQGQLQSQAAVFTTLPYATSTGNFAILPFGGVFIQSGATYLPFPGDTSQIRCELELKAFIAAHYK